MENAENKSKFDYTTLSLPKQQLWLTCKRIMKALKYGSCTDEEVRDVMVMGDAKARGYVNLQDYLNADQAMKLLRVSRNRFFILIKQYGVKSKKRGSKTLGYNRSDIEMILSHEADNQVRRKRT